MIDASLLTLVLTIFSIASVLGAGLALFRASYAKATNDALRENNEALVARVSILESEITRLGVYEKENILLRTLIPSEDVIRGMIVQHESWATQLSEEHKMMMSVLETISKLLRRRPPQTRSPRA